MCHIIQGNLIKFSTVAVMGSFTKNNQYRYHYAIIRLDTIALLSNIRLVSKWLKVTNTLAYCGAAEKVLQHSPRLIIGVMAKLS
jgi:hypothetical protein